MAEVQLAGEAAEAPERAMIACSQVGSLAPKIKERYDAWRSMQGNGRAIPRIDFHPLASYSPSHPAKNLRPPEAGGSFAASRNCIEGVSQRPFLSESTPERSNPLSGGVRASFPLDSLRAVPSLPDRRPSPFVQGRHARRKRRPVGAAGRLAPSVRGEGRARRRRRAGLAE